MEQFFSEKKRRFVTAFDLFKCPKQIRYPRSLHTFAPISESPSIVSTKVLTVCKRYTL